MTENKVQTAVKKLLKTAIPQRIETWTGIGIFDSNWEFNGEDLWIEYKQAHKKKSKHPSCDYKIAWRKGQIPWAVKRISNGANNLFVAYLIVDELIFIHLNLARIALLRDHVDFSLLKELDEKSRKMLKL